MKIIIFIILLTYCISEQQSPKGISPTAVYDKKRNLYILVENGVRKQFTEKGQLYSECEVDSQGREHGICKTFLPETGQVLSEGRYINGERDGVWIWNFPDGKPYYKLSFSHKKKRKVWLETNLLGNEHGEYFRFYNNGKLEEKGFYDTGLKTGKWERYYLNGKLEYTGNFFQDKKILDWTYYYPNGSLEAEESFTKEGTLIQRTTYYPNGNLACVVKDYNFSCY